MFSFRHNPLPFSCLLFILFFGVAIQTACTHHYHVSKQTSQTIRLDTAVSTQSAQDIDRMIQPYREEVEAKMSQVIGETAVPLRKAQPESTMGNFTADCLAEKAAAYTDLPIAFAVQNYSGLRIPRIPAGDITNRQVFEMMPFNNMLVVLALDGETTNRFIQHMAKNGGEPVSRGLRYRIQDDQAVDITIDDEPIKLDTTYYIATADWVANGSGNRDYLRAFSQLQTKYQVREVYTQCIEEAATRGKPIHPKLDGRVSIDP